mmetsp:Transcript_57527/g.95756  ORF Transcript_57527/g.95756 Transcript_57527/m.95756 type:complete len:284 (+) Transcript_57527:70-921(+)
MLSESNTREHREGLADEHTDSDGTVNWTAEAAPAQSAGGSRGSQPSREDGDAEPALAGVAAMFAGPNKHSGEIQQGGAAVRALAFLGSGVSIILTAFSILNPMVLFGSPIVWAIAAYQGVFSITTLVFEAKPQWIQNVSSSLDVYQDCVMSNAAFLATCLGRGLFYIFQGTLWGAVGHSLPIDEHRPLESFFLFIFETSTRVLGIYFILLGVVHLLMHYNILPQQYARKIRRGSIMVTDRVATALEQLRERRGRAEEANQQAASGSASVPLRAGSSEVELPSR